MPRQVGLDELIAMTGAMAPGIVALDGLPASGKSTLADRLQAAHKFELICLDDFMLPQSQWRSQNRPAFPFEFARYDEFMTAMKTLSETGACTFIPFDWAVLRLSTKPRTVRLDRPVVLEGVSTLHPDLCRYYALKVFVESDRTTTDQASKMRGLGLWADPWEQLFLPSADIYMRTRPQERADLIYPGRGGMKPATPSP